MGMSGLLEGRHYTVAGRVVYGVTIAGEKYTWNEFTLRAASGDPAILVFEVIETGPAWKLFRQIDPVSRLTVEEAGRRRVGDVVAINGQQARVTAVDRATVLHIEGHAPDGVRKGQAVDYFNAEWSDTLIAVNWSRQDVEYYEGHIIRRQRIESAFGMPVKSGIATWFHEQYSAGRDSFQAIVAILAFTCFIVFKILDGFDFSPGVSSDPPPKLVATAVPLSVGHRGVLSGHAYKIDAHAVLEVSRMGRGFDRHEFILVDPEGHRVLLISDPGDSPTAWYQMTSLTVPVELTPFRAAEFRPDTRAKIAGASVRIAQLFATKVLNSEGHVTGEFWPSAIQFAFVAKSKEAVFMARWTESNLNLFQLHPVTPDEFNLFLREAPEARD